MFEYCLLIISVEIYSIYKGYGEDFSAGSFILNALFSHTRIIILAIIAIQILFHALRKYKKYIDYGSVLLALVSICLFLAFGSFWEKNSTNTLLIIFLAIMTLCAIQPKKFSFYYFLLLGIIIYLIPIRQEPINWTPVTDKASVVIDNVSYYFSNILGTDKYTTGYSSLTNSGNQLKISDTTQLIITTNNPPYFIFYDETTSKRMKQAKTLYLTGTDSADISHLVEFANLLWRNDVDKETTALFSTISDLSLEYSFLTTRDEIAPINTISLTDENGNPLQTNNKKHQKGYTLNATYFEIDYGSPYLMELYRNPVSSDSYLDYDSCCDYLKSLYDINFSKIISEDAYNDCVENLQNVNVDYLDTDGVTERMISLASTVAGDYASVFDKCKAIENYLRQYTYSTDLDSDAVEADMNEAAGMSMLADNFLFDTGKGYCVHYTSSMVMLLRLSGIPARAASGFYYQFPLDAASSYNVSAACAHTWPEAYIKNVGWVPFEPTSQFIPAEYRSWRKQLEKDTGSVNTPSVPAIPDTIEDDTSTESITAFHVAKIIAVIFASLVGLLVMVFLGLKIFYELRYILASPERKLELDVQQIKKTIQKNTDEEIYDRGLLSDYVKMAPSYIQDDAKRMFELYYKVKYGGKS